MRFLGMVHTKFELKKKIFNKFWLFLLTSVFQFIVLEGVGCVMIFVKVAYLQHVTIPNCYIILS